jgi:hypothetical protein
MVGPLYRGRSEGVRGRLERVKPATGGGDRSRCARRRRKQANVSPVYPFPARIVSEDGGARPYPRSTESSARRTDACMVLLAPLDRSSLIQLLPSNLHCLLMFDTV